MVSTARELHSRKSQSTKLLEEVKELREVNETEARCAYGKVPGYGLVWVGNGSGSGKEVRRSKEETRTWTGSMGVVTNKKFISWGGAGISEMDAAEEVVEEVIAKRMQARPTGDLCCLREED